MKLLIIFLLCFFLPFVSSELGLVDNVSYSNLIVDGSSIIQEDTYKFNDGLGEITILREISLNQPFKLAAYGQAIIFPGNMIADCMITSEKNSNDFYDYEDSTTGKFCNGQSNIFGAHEFISENNIRWEKEFLFKIQSSIKEIFLDVILPWRKRNIQICSVNLIQDYSSKKNAIPLIEDYRGFQDVKFGGKNSFVEISGLVYEIYRVNIKAPTFEENISLDYTRDHTLSMLFTPIYEEKGISLFTGETTPLKLTEFSSSEDYLYQPSFCLNFVFKKSLMFIFWFYVSLLSYTIIFFAKRKEIFSNNSFKKEYLGYLEFSWKAYLFFLALSFFSLSVVIVFSSFLYYLFMGVILIVGMKIVNKIKKVLI